MTGLNWPARWQRSMAVALGLAAVGLFAALAASGIGEGEAGVPLWGRFEASVTNDTAYADPFRDVSLDVTFSRPDGSTVDFWGFYDGGETWRFRFMCDQVGTWTYDASFSDGTAGTSGAFDCVTSDLPGMISEDETNPMWLGFEGGNHVLIRSFRIGDRFFASDWDDPADPNDGDKRTAFLDWAQGQGYNTLAIGSHYLKRDEPERGGPWDLPDLWDESARTLHPAEYDKAEVILDDLAERRIIAFPVSGFFGKNSDYPRDEADQVLYIRYTMARFGYYWNVMLNVAGPEPNFGWMSNSDVIRLGKEIAADDAFGHARTVHNNHNVGDPFRDSSWSTFSTLNGAKTTDLEKVSSYLLASTSRNPVKPVYAEEVMWYGGAWHPDYSDVDLRKVSFVINQSAASLNFGDMDGNSSTGFSGSMDLAQRRQDKHDIVKRVWDFYETVPFYRMSPRQDLVSGGYALAEPGEQYLVYLPSGGTVDVAVTGGPYDVEWINAQDTSDRRPDGSTSDGVGLTSPTDGDDWLLYLTGADATPPATATATPTPTPTASATPTTTSTATATATPTATPTPTPTPTPCADSDGDGWTDCEESYIGTDSLMSCTPGGWPPDPEPSPDGNGVVQIDDVSFAARAFGSTTTPRAEIASQDGTVQIDDISAFADRFGQTC